MFTRGDYLSGKCSHEEYYGQYVDGNVRAAVLSVFNEYRLVNAYKQDKHFNTIPLYHWDALSLAFRFGAAMGIRGDIPTLAGKVSILKEAARQIVETLIKEGRYDQVLIEGSRTIE